MPTTIKITMDQKEQILKEYGLTDNEIQVYLASLRLGCAKVNTISKKANLHRTTTYEVLKSLVKKGLASYVIKSGIKYFEASEPNKLINILEEKKDKIYSILPELNSLKASTLKKPHIEIYEGKEGFKTILDDIIKTKPKEILTLSSAKIFNILTFYFPKWIKMRVENNIPARILQEKTEITKNLLPKNNTELREIRFLPKNFKISTHIQIYDNKIAILTLRKKEPIGTLIEDDDIVETHRSLFNYLWDNAEIIRPHNKKHH